MLIVKAIKGKLRQLNVNKFIDMGGKTWKGEERENTDKETKQTQRKMTRDRITEKEMI